MAVAIQELAQSAEHLAFLEPLFAPTQEVAVNYARGRYNQSAGTP